MPALLSRPKPYYGWVIVGVLAITETISWGIIHYAFSVFITPMEAELGWTRGQLAVGFSLSLLMMALWAYPVGHWIDHYGGRALMTVGSFLATLLIVAWSRVDTLPAFYLIWGGLGVCAALVLYEPAFAICAAWFRLRLGRALAIITFAAGLASTIFLPLSNALLLAFGWRDAVLGLALLLGATTIPLHALFLRRRPQDVGLTIDGQASRLPGKAPAVDLRAVFKGRIFWLLTLIFSLSFLASSAIRVHFIPYLIGSGISATVAATVSGAIGLMQVVGRVLFAPLEARFPPRTMVLGVLALQTLSLSLLLLGVAPMLMGLFVVVYGASYGAGILARAAIVADQYGASHYGRISSVMSTFLTLCGTVAPAAAGWLYDQAGNYTPVLWSAFGLSFAPILIMWWFMAAPAPKPPALNIR